MDHKPVLLQQASNKQGLTNWENMLITKNKDHIINFKIRPADHLTKKFILNPVDHIINFEILPADHLTKKLILNPVESNRSAPTRIPN